MPNIKRVIYFLIFGAVVIFVVRYFLTHSYSIYGNRVIIIEIGDNELHTEVVSTPDKLARGLGKRRKLCDSCAMLFVFQKDGKHSFWMKDMLLPLDIIWIDDNKIVNIEKNIQADFDGVLTPEADADAVLEINAGKADKLGIMVGDEIKF